jgi:hypothetical protein
VSDNHRDSTYKKGIWLGIGAAGLAHLVVQLALVLLTDFGMIFFLLIGLSQLLYLVPLSVVVLAKREYGKAMSVGIWIAAGITFLLNAACFGLFASGVMNLSF